MAVRGEISNADATAGQGAAQFDETMGILCEKADAGETRGLKRKPPGTGEGDGR